jgi:hypothetical protein
MVNGRNHKSVLFWIDYNCESMRETGCTDVGYKSFAEIL